MTINTHIQKMAAALLLLALIASMLGGCGSKTDAMEFVSLRFSGYDGNGQAELEVDYDSMIMSIIGDEPDDSSEAFGKWMNQYLIYDEGISITCSPNTGLSNGDVVTVTVSLSDTAAQKVTGGSKTFPVSWLPEVKTVDIFKDIALYYEGIVGDYTTVRLEKLSSETLIQDCIFIVEPQANVKNDDTVTVTIQNPDILAKKHHAVPAEISKTFTVSGLDEYLTNPSLLPVERIQEIIAHYVPNSLVENDFIYTYDNPSYYRTFFCIGREDVIGADFNRLCIYACFDEFMDGVYNGTVYKPLVFRNLIVTADGTIRLEYEDGETAVFQSSPEEVMEYMEEFYIVTEVNVHP